MRQIGAWGRTTDYYSSRTGGPATLRPRRHPVVYGGSDGPLNLEQAKFYDEFGYLLLKSVFSTAEVADLLAETALLKQIFAGEQREELVCEPQSDELRTLFAAHSHRPLFKRLATDQRLVGPATQILGSDIYVHQSRINIKKALNGRSFPWHSDFETWHVEDGLPSPRCLTACVFLTANTQFNGPVFLITSSHLQYAACPGQTPENHYQESLRWQEYGSPPVSIIGELVNNGRLASATGAAGDVLLFDGNTMHSSPDNLSNVPRTNLFVAYNSVLNLPEEPFGGQDPRPEYLASRDFTRV